MIDSTSSNVLWTPDPARLVASQMHAFRQHLANVLGTPIESPAALHAASVRHASEFWDAVWAFTGVVGDRGDGPAASGLESMRDARFFEGARLNFAENLLHHRGSAPAIIAASESGARREMSFAELHDAVAAMASALVAMGVTREDRVAAVMPNVPETVVIMLAAASLGATFSSCSPDFGTAGIVDRLAPLAPRVCFFVDGYRYKGRAYACGEKAAEVAAKLPSPCHHVWVRNVDEGAAPAGFVDYQTLYAAHEGADLTFERFPFDHPLYVLFSSGTTGKPKGFVHGAGGTLVQHLKEHRLHLDVRPEDRLFCFTTCGWMMWNWLVSGLASGAAIVLFDGFPLHPDPTSLLALARRESISHFGASAKYFDGLRKDEVTFGGGAGLAHIRVVVSTGSPLSEDAFDYVYREIGRDLQLASISGGTDIVSCFVLGDPTKPVLRGEIQGPGLGMDVQVFDADGQRVKEQMGELVCATAFPSMPVRFWDDPDGARYRKAYFERFAGVWCHGDFCMETAAGGFVITGRSDTVLNPGGVRIGTAEIYRPTEALAEVAEAVAIGQPHEGDLRVVLFVRLAEGRVLDDALRKLIKDTIRRQASPRHVPAVVAHVPDIPRTRSGKVSEVSVRDAVLGRPIQNRDALENPEALAHFADHPALSDPPQG